MKIFYQKIEPFEGLKELLKSVTNYPDSVFTDIVNKYSSVIAVNVDDKLVGYIICNAVFNHKKELILTVKYCISVDHKTGLYKSMLEFDSFCTWAASKGFSVLVFESDLREGMFKLLSNAGFKQDRIIYSRNIGDLWEKTIQTQANEAKQLHPIMTTG